MDWRSHRAAPDTTAKSPPPSLNVLVAIVKKRINLDVSLYTFLQIFSLTLFEKMPI